LVANRAQLFEQNVTQQAQPLLKKETNEHIVNIPITNHQLSKPKPPVLVSTQQSGPLSAQPCSQTTPAPPISRPRKKSTITTEQVVSRLKNISKEEDPLKHFRHLIKIGQG
jgi:hypothetical protein